MMLRNKPINAGQSLPWGILSFALLVLLEAGLPADLLAANVQANDPGAPEANWQSETTIVEFDYDDPSDSPNLGIQDVILVGYNDFNPLNNSAGGFFYPRVGISRSLDGAAFRHTTLPASGLVGTPAGTIQRGDPVLAVDYHAGLDGLSNPKVLLAHMASPVPAVGSLTVQMYLSASTDGGRNFPAAGAVPISNPPTGTSDDKLWLAVDQRGGARPPDGNAYVCWTRIAKNAAGALVSSQILLSQIPPGAPPGPEIAITPVRAAPRFVQSCQVAIDTEGHVYVAWTDFMNDLTNTPSLMIRHASPPAGANPVVFDSPTRIEQLRGASAAVPGGIVNCLAPNWLPQGSRGPFLYNFTMNASSLATDPASGRVYITWSMWNGPRTANGPSRFDVFLKSAPRPGLSGLWGRRQVVNRDGPTTTDQLMPSIATYPLPVYPLSLIGTPTVKIAWSDKRNSGAANNAFEIFGAESPFSSDAPISDAGTEPMNPAGARLSCRIGDYNAITSADIDVGTPDGGGPGTYFLHAWGDTRGSAVNAPEIFFASESFTPDTIIDIPPVFVDLSMFTLSPGTSGVQLPVHEPFPMPLHIGIANLSPNSVDADTWIGVSAPPGVRLSLQGVEQSDACFGPAPPDLAGPAVAVIGVPCTEGPIVALGSEHKIEPAFQISHDRTLEITCEEIGAFEVQVFSGTGPVQPLEIEDDDLSNNGRETSIMVNCLPGGPPPAPGNLAWSSDDKMDWSPVSGASTYRLYRGEAASAPWLATPAIDSCVRLETATPVTNLLTELPAPGSFFWYLITALDASGLESLDPERMIDSAGTCSVCPHDKCITGVPLAASCGACAGIICGADPYCCQTQWDSVCVGEVLTLCGSAQCRSNAGSCAHVHCRESFSPLSPDCDVPPLAASCVGGVCSVDPYCCESAWDSFCVSEVSSVCGLGCY